MFCPAGWRWVSSARGCPLSRLFYSVFFYLITPLVCLRLWWRGRRVPGYRRRWRERFGFIPPVSAGGETPPLIWVHAVSVGETIAAVPMIERLQQQFPHHMIAVTTTTPTGSDRVSAMLGDSVYHCYAPYDLPDAVARTLRRLRPELLIIMETELWPNLVAACHRRGIPVLVANARLSEKSARGYRRFAGLTAPMLAQIATVAAQYDDDGERFVSLGLPRRNLAVTGNIKFDFALSEQQRLQAAALAAQWRGQGPDDSEGRPVWLVASTHPGEEEILLDAFVAVRERHPQTLLVLVPRHPDRFDAVAALCQRRGFSLRRRSRGEAPAADTAILLGDTMGELPVFYGACDLAFVGGSLVPVGGHNLLEPAAWGKPVLSGSRLFNFAEISSLMLAGDALLICDDAASVAAQVTALLDDPGARQRRGRAAEAVVAANRGAMDRLLAIVARLMA